MATLTLILALLRVLVTAIFEDLNQMIKSTWRRLSVKQLSISPSSLIVVLNYGILNLISKLIQSRDLLNIKTFKNGTTHLY